MNDLDFELELIQKDEINVAYILSLLAKLKNAKPDDQEKQRKAISDMMSSDTKLRSKKKLIEKFIDQKVFFYQSKDRRCVCPIISI